jgi:hypothetical protein
VLGLVVSLEGLLRLREGAQADATGLDPVHVYSETYGWALRPGFRHTAQGRTISVNDKGYRGKEYDFVRSPATLRVVMLGDSIAFGPGVDDADMFSHRLDSTRVAWEVINLGVMGYGTDQELLKLEREGLAYDPDVVVLHFCLQNDFADNMLSRALYDGVHPKPYFTLEAGELRKHDAHLKTTLGQRTAFFLHSNSFLYRRAMATAANLAAPATASREQAAGPHWLDRMEQALQDMGRATEVTLRLLEAMRRLADASGAGFIVMVHPDESGFHHESRLTAKIQRSPRLKGATVIAMAEAYRARGLRWEQFALDSLGHLSPAGHQVVADVLGASLSDEGGVLSRVVRDPRRGNAVTGSLAEP